MSTSSADVGLNDTDGVGSGRSTGRSVMLGIVGVGATVLFWYVGLAFLVGGAVEACRHFADDEPNSVPVGLALIVVGICVSVVPELVMRHLARTASGRRVWLVVAMFPLLLGIFLTVATTVSVSDGSCRGSL